MSRFKGIGAGRLPQHTAGEAGVSDDVATFTQHLKVLFTCAGFAGLEPGHPARAPLPADTRGKLCVTRNGVALCFGGRQCRVYHQGSGELLANLPLVATLVATFVHELERRVPLAGAVAAAPGSETRAAVDALAREHVARELLHNEDLRQRLEGWLAAAGVGPVARHTAHA